MCQGNYQINTELLLARTWNSFYIVEACHTLKTKSRHDANFIVIGGTITRTRWHQQRQSCHHDNPRFFYFFYLHKSLEPKSYVHLVRYALSFLTQFLRFQLEARLGYMSTSADVRSNTSSPNDVHVPSLCGTCFGGGGGGGGKILQKFWFISKIKVNL